MTIDATLLGGLFKTITPSQLSGIETIVQEFGDGDKNQLAYVLSTVYHETGKKMQPVKEFGGEAYLKSKKYYPYYGRDLTQTTWLDNYKKVKKFSGIDVVSNPDLIGQMPLAAKVAVTFMKNGWYTGKKLSDYINDKKVDFINARRIINGTDKAELIMSYASKFLTALK